MKQVLQVLAQDKKLWIISSICAIIAVILQVASPYVVGLCIDVLQTTFSIREIMVLVLILVSMYLGYSISNYFMQRYAAYVSIQVAKRLREQLTNKLTYLPISYFHYHPKGDIVYRFINDIETISDGLLQGIATMLSGVMTILFTLCIMLYLNVILTIMVVIFAPFLFWLARFISIHTHKNFIEQANAAGKLHSYGKEMLEGVHVVKAYGYEKKAAQEFQAYNQTLYTVGVKAQFYGSLTNPSTRFITNITYAFVGGAGAYLALKGSISIGDVFSFLMYANLFSKPFTELTGVITQLQTALSSAKRIFEVLNAQEEQEEPQTMIHDVQGDIQFSNVSFSYTPDKLLLQNISLHVKVGEKVAIVGQTGAGKTTIMNLLLRFYDVQEGAIYLDGINIQTISRDALRSQFGMVLQETTLIEGTIMDNIRYGYVDASEEDVIQAAKQSGAHHFIQGLTQGYDTDVVKQHTLSKGQQQLLAITRCFLRKPKILLLDEATSSMDSVSELQVSQALDTLMQDKTVFVIAHRLSTIKQADKILVMEKGNIVEQGTHQELLDKQNVYAQLYHSQFQS